ncbi:hypothetical protein Hdeb2414_s0001g00019241 [Helianthus debilis subsp. tardiflorus]
MVSGETLLRHLTHTLQSLRFRQPKVTGWPQPTTAASISSREVKEQRNREIERVRLAERGEVPPLTATEVAARRWFCSDKTPGNIPFLPSFVF